MPLPSWGISVSHTRATKKARATDQLNFGATVWIGGHSPLDVEGFRSGGSPTMKAYQYFWRNGRVIGRARVETMGFAGYNHWHFEQFAQYRLLTSAKTLVVRSHKEGFCIAPTDPVDLVLPGATWQPSSIGLNGQCGDPSALWVTEMLPVGWGDTYFQSVPGESFNITAVPDGTYYIEVIANPLRLLYETDTGNDVSLRKVVLGGTPGHRTVRVPAFHGIDPESGPGGGSRSSATRRPCRASAPSGRPLNRHGQGLKAPQRERRPSDRRSGQLEMAEAGQQRGERHLAFQPGQRRAEAVVDAAAEGHMAVGVTGDVEAARIGEGRRVTVRRSEHQHDLIAGPDPPTGQVEVLGGNPLGDLDRAVEPEQLVDGTGDQLGRAPQQLKLARSAQQGEDAVADEVHSRLVPGDQEKHREVDDLRRRDAITVSLHGEQAGQQVVARRPAPVGEQVIQVSGQSLLSLGDGRVDLR